MPGDHDILDVFAEHGIDLGELVTAINSVEQDYSKPYNYDSFIRFLDMVNHVKDNEILDRIEELVNNYCKCTLVITPYGMEGVVDINSWLYSTKYLIVPLPDSIEFRLDEIDEEEEWKEPLRRYLGENNIYSKLRDIGEIIDAVYDCNSLGSCIVLAMIMKPNIQLSSKEIAKLNMKLIKVNQNRRSTIEEIVGILYNHLYKKNPMKHGRSVAV